MMRPNKEGASSYIQMHLLASTPSCPLMVAERAGYIFIIILDPEYIFTLPETPAKQAQQRGGHPSIKSDDASQ